MINSLKNKLPIFACCVLLGLIIACSNPDEDIKELNENQLGDVIDTLFVDKEEVKTNPEQADSTISTDSLTQSTNSIKSSIENQTVVLSNNVPEVIENVATTEPTVEAQAVETQTPIESSIEEQADDSQVDASIVSPNDQAGIQLDAIETNEIAANNKEEKIANTNFSDPITESLTPAETILKDILATNQPIDYANVSLNEEQTAIIEDYCQKISKRLSSVSLKLCRDSNHRISPFNTVNGLPIVVSEFAAKPDKKPLGKILVIGGTHGDELTSVSTAYNWISKLNRFHSGLFHWHIAPAINADAVLSRPATRQNANGVDLNRNLPTPDWKNQSIIRWEKINNDSRKAPGNEPASEPEAKWIMHEIATFQPDIIVSIHAPYGLLDFDAPKLSKAPESFGRIQLNLLGTYPGSLGNYAGIQLQIPVLTLELANAGTMPAQNELDAIWGDMIRWLRSQLNSDQS